MPASYGIVMGAGVIVCFLIYGIRLRKSGLRFALAAASVIPAAVLGVVLAKVCYVLLLGGRELGRYGMAAFITRIEPKRMSIFGGALGVCLGVAMTARLMKTQVGRALDCFAPAGALLWAVTRWQEGALGTFGLGKSRWGIPTLADPSILLRPPFVVSYQGTDYPPVYALAALAAAVCAAVFLLRKKKETEPGLLFEKTLYFLVLPVIFTESLRTAIFLKHGFVRMEQVTAAVVLLALLARSCRRSGRKGWAAWWPVPVFFAAVGVLIAMEFALDKWDLDNRICYAIMLLTLGGMGALEAFAVRRRRAR